MARKSKPSFYVRKFINKPGHNTVASVLIEIGRGGDVIFTLSDCTRMVNLDFSTYSKEDRTNSLYKAEVLIQTLTEFKEALEKYFEAYPSVERDY